MIGAEFEMYGRTFQCVVLRHKSHEVKRVMAIKFTPFVEYGYFAETSYTDRGYIAKSQLRNLKSTRIISNDLSSQVVFHRPNITENMEAWVNGTQTGAE